MYDRIILIGNGFDLAHGLPTSYFDFLLWYANSTIKDFNRGYLQNYANGNVRIKTNGRDLPPVINLQQFANIENLKFDNKLLESIFTNPSLNNWVDIEYVYYSELIKIYKTFEHYNVERDAGIEASLKHLNENLKHLRFKLSEYLNQLDYSKLKPKQAILDKLKTERNPELNYKTIFVIFNYTNTFNLLYKNDVVKEKDIVLYIHGELKSNTNPIIFGYGDETDKYYQEIERLNINDFICNFKSFKYFHSNNYRKLFNSMYNPYEVTIIGHSCGISDRVLLKEIFTGKRCQEINIYHYKRPDGTTDFEEKTQEISRHFPANLKHKMRTMIFDRGPLVG